ncbi:MAG: hypothetical protein QM770_07600 [Tepidisphaeraceae bacterium]
MFKVLRRGLDGAERFARWARHVFRPVNERPPPTHLVAESGRWIVLTSVALGCLTNLAWLFAFEAGSGPMLLLAGAAVAELGIGMVWWWWSLEEHHRNRRYEIRCAKREALEWVRYELEQAQRAAAEAKGGGHDA